MSTLITRLTRSWGLKYPILSAPMAFAGGGLLAAAVSRAGGLGLIGGGYGDSAWLEEQFALTQGYPVGVGFITWSLSDSPSLLSQVLKYKPSVVMLSFGDPRPFVDEIRSSGARVICQCQTMGHIKDAIDIDADAIVVQGSEAGGHGSLRGSITFIPEAADYIKSNAPNILLLAAGGIADGRGLAASLMLGADGVLMGTRFWASREALVHPRHHEAIIHTNGDGTIRTHVADIVRQIPWPVEFTARVRHNTFTKKWHGCEEELKSSITLEAHQYRTAFAEGDTENTGVWFGEAAGLIHSIEPAEIIIENMVNDAIACLKQYSL